MENISAYLQILFAVIGLLSAVAAVTPNQWDNKIMATIRGIIDLGGMNFWNAKNAQK